MVTGSSIAPLQFYTYRAFIIKVAMSIGRLKKKTFCGPTNVLTSSCKPAYFVDL